MSQGESQLSHILHAAERWANQTDEHSVEEHTGQITYLRELVESAMSEQGNSLPMHLLRSGIMRPLATLQRQLAYMVAQSMYQDPEQAALRAQAAPRTQPSPPGRGRLCWPGPSPVARSPRGPELSGSAHLADECTLVMILLFQVNPPASESALTVDHMRSLFECVLREYYHHDVRTISAMMLERIADARQRGGGLALPPESLFSLASRIEEQLASAKQCTPGRRSNRGPAGPGQAFSPSHARAPPRTDGLQTGMVSLLAKAAALHAPCSQALQALPMDSP